MIAIGTLFDSFKQAADVYFGADSLVTFPAIFTSVIRWFFPILAFVILYRCGVSLLSWKKEPEVWANLTLPNGSSLQVTHWENIIGRAASSDIRINYPSVSRSHAVLCRESGGWTISDIGSKGGVYKNGELVVGKDSVKFGDVLSLGGVELTLVPYGEEAIIEEGKKRTRPGRFIKPSVTLILLTLFQLLTMQQLIMSKLPDFDLTVPIVFLLLIGVMWLYFFIIRSMKRTGFEVETIAFFLTTLGFSVIASTGPDGLVKQFSAFLLGLMIFIILSWILRDLDRAKKLRYYVAALGIALFVFNLIFGKEVYGAKNWVFIGPFSFQPSELVKIAFIFTGASTLDRLMSKRNLYLFIIYTAVCCGCLALMNDFGTAIIFFVAFVVIAYLRSGDFTTISLVCTGTAFAGMLVLRFRPYIMNRFEAWRHVWEYASTSGYQQTRTLMYAASGGLLGLGAGNGYLKYVAAADTDLVFGFLCEEWGILIAGFAVVSIVVLAAFTVKSSSVGRSSFYVIGACAAMSMLAVQTILNVFGSVDLLPLTGVTFPFVSNGGSSMLSSWGLLAFVKAADTRQNASFAIKLAGKNKHDIEEEDYDMDEDIEEEPYDEDF